MVYLLNMVMFYSYVSLPEGNIGSFWTTFQSHQATETTFRRVEKDLQGCSLVPFWTISSRNNEINFYTHLPYLTEGLTRNGARKSGSLHERKVSRLIDKPQKLAVCKPIPMDSHFSLYTHQKSHSLYTILYIPIKNPSAGLNILWDIYVFFYGILIILGL